VRLLFDQNLSPRLVRWVADLFPESMHVRDVGLQSADDHAVWDYARDHGFVVASKDAVLLGRWAVGEDGSAGLAAVCLWRHRGRHGRD
jgi:predicted nuclease of predicted toxin-antitoxin system